MQTYIESELILVFVMIVAVKDDMVWGLSPSSGKVTECSQSCMLGLMAELWNVVVCAGK